MITWFINDYFAISKLTENVAITLDINDSRAATFWSAYSLTVTENITLGYLTWALNLEDW